VGRIHAERENCDYFPSYESVMLTKQSYVWEDDLMHISDSFVSKIVSRLVSARLDGRESKGRLSVVDTLVRFQECIQRGNGEGALAIYQEIAPHANDIVIPALHKQAAILLMDARDFPAALLHAGKLVELRPGRWQPLYLLARVQHQSGDPNLAKLTAARALALTRNKKQGDLVEGLISRLATPTVRR